jgi:hypothetical protein
VELKIEPYGQAMRFLIVPLAIAMSTSGAGPEALERRSPNPLSSLETGLIEEVNRMRQDPQGYAAWLEDQRKYYRGDVLEFPGTPRIRTTEGPSALDEAVRALRALQPLPRLSVSTGLCLAARDHVADQGPKGGVGHAGSDLSNASSRARRYARSSAYVSENIIYGAHNTAWMLLRFLTDSGIPDRGHRKNLLHQEYRLVGVACGPHAAYDSMCVLDFARDYTERAEALVAERSVPAASTR